MNLHKTYTRILRVCMCVYIDIYVYTCTYIYIYTDIPNLFIFIYIPAKTYTSPHAHIRICVHVYVYVFVSVVMYRKLVSFASHTSVAHGMHGDAITSTAPGASATTSWSGTHVCISWEEIDYTQGRSAWSLRVHVHHGWYVSQGVGRLCGECRPSGHRQ